MLIRGITYQESKSMPLSHNIAVLHVLFLPTLVNIKMIIQLEQTMNYFT